MIDGYNVFFLKNLFPVSPPSHGFSDIQKKSTTKSIKTVKNSFGCRGGGAGCSKGLSWCDLHG